jgi:spore coat assemly protein
MLYEGGVRVEFKEGDLVGRKSYNSDILFKIKKINETNAVLKGLDFRLLADAPLEDLAAPSAERIKEYKEKTKKMESRCLEHIFKRRSLDKEKMRSNSNSFENDFIEMPGKVLHIDGDREYLSECLRAYATLGISARGEFLVESEQPRGVVPLLEKYQPDLLVLTGHDAYIKMSRENFQSMKAYRNSRYFLEAVKEARRYEKGKDDLIIFAGGCQSYYEALIDGGANFASSPQRVLIHCLDPVFIMEKVCYTGINLTVNVREAISSSITGLEGLGGIETRGKFRLGLPKSPY